MPRTDQVRVAAEIDAFIQYALVPAGLTPPAVPVGEREARDGEAWGVVEHRLPEDAPWNQWPGDGARLFNNRMAHLFQVRVVGQGRVHWLAGRTALELNDENTRLAALASPEGMLGDLLYFANQQEQWVLEGDLVQRTRAAGGFRSAYLPQTADGVLEGVIAFPMLSDALPDGGMGLADQQVVAMRLTVAFADAAGEHELVWLLE